jgi:ABC-type transporter Mla subunit MlaD
MAPRATLKSIQNGGPGTFTDAAGRKWTAANISEYSKPNTRKKYEQSADDIAASVATRRQRELLKDESALGKLSLDYERGLVTKKAIDSPEFSAELAKKMGEQMAVMTKKVTDDINVKLSDDINKAIGETTKILTSTANGLSQEIVDAATTANKVMRESAGKIKDFAALQDAVDTNLKRTIENINKLDASTSKIDSSILAVQKATKQKESQVNKQFDILQDSMNKVTSTTETMKNLVEESSEQIKKGFIPAVNNLGHLINALYSTTESFEKAIDKLTDKVAQPTAPQQTTQALETQALAQSAAQSALPPGATTI